MPSDVKPFLGRKIVTIKCEIMPTEMIDLKNISRQSEVKNKAIIQFLEILSSQDLAKG